MRLFIAVELPEEIKDALASSADRLRDLCESGRFSHRENYHLTLAFLGEVEQRRVSEIKRIMDACRCGRFGIRIGGFGSFKRDGGDIIWRAADGGKMLCALRRQLADGLAERGFMLDKGAFRPHLTLVRQAVLKPQADIASLLSETGELFFTADRVSLMNSQRIDGRLTYTPLHRTYFNAAEH